jgi:RNA polymerase sigma-B factor
MALTETSRALTGAVDSAALFERWQALGDRRAQDELVKRYMPLAYNLARRYIRSSEPYEDLVQVACLGLVKAVERFDPSRGYAFTSLAVPTILGELRRYFRDSSWAVHVERGAQERAREITAAQQALGARTGRVTTVGELSEYLELTEEQVLDGLQASEAYDAVSLDAPPGGGGDGPASRLETIGEQDEQLALVDDMATIIAVARHLPIRERLVLYLRFGEDLPQTEIARRIGVSQMQVSRLIRRALHRLGELTAGGPPSERVVDHHQAQ